MVSGVVLTQRIRHNYIFCFTTDTTNLLHLLLILHHARELALCVLVHLFNHCIFYQYTMMYPDVLCVFGVRLVYC